MDSASTVGEHGLDQEVSRAAIWGIDLEAGTTSMVATRLRNPVSIAWEAEAGRFGPEPGMVVGRPGSWNQKSKSSYKVVFVPFEGGQPEELPRDVLIGCWWPTMSGT